MKAIVHIGTEKTGTTSIQEFLYQNKKKLKSAGFHFIQSAGQKNNRALPAYCISDDQFDDFFREKGIKTLEGKEQFKRIFIEEFANEIHSVPGNIHTFIISSEHFHSRIRSEAEMDNVHKLLSTYFDELKIVCYLREQATTCTSSYSTHMKTGGTDSFTAYLRRCKPGNYFYNYHEMLANWERCFGFDALDVSLFAQDRFLNGDLLDDFTAKIDPALIGTLNKLIHAENESLKPVGQSLARAVNITFPVKSGRSEAHELRDRCKKVIAQDFTGKGQQPSLEARKLIYDSFIESNEQIRQKFFPKLETLFLPPAEAAEPDNIIAEDDFQGIADVFSVLRKHGKGTMLPEEYAHVCTTIFSCISDITSVVSDANEGGTKMNLNQDDVSLLLCAAGSIQGRDADSAFRLVALAHKVFPNSPGIKEKMEEYRQRSKQVPKPQYIVTYHSAGSSLDRDEVKRLMAEFQSWLSSLDVPEGSPLIRLTHSSTVRSDGTVVDAGQSSRVGFSIFQAESLDDALSITKRCPFLDMGGTLEVSEIGQLQAQ